MIKVLVEGEIPQYKKCCYICGGMFLFDYTDLKVSHLPYCERPFMVKCPCCGNAYEFTKEGLDKIRFIG